MSNTEREGQRVVNPKIRAIIMTDYLALVSVVVPVGLWTGCVALAIRVRLGVPRNAVALDMCESSLLTIALIATVICTSALVRRIRRIRRLIRHGCHANATVTMIWFFRDRGRIEFEYTRDGIVVQSGLALHKTKKTAALQVGQQIQVLVDPNRPKQIVIPELYA
jgi:hypothetical protein